MTEIPEKPLLPALCQDCLAVFRVSSSRNMRCPHCRSPRTIAHAELESLSIAHLDCDAFYASVEKRDHPELADTPLIIGGGTRGVVSTCCYLARTFGVHSAMPMFKALQACPDAVVMPPNMTKYQAVSQQIRTLMADLTPAIEPVSIDEAFLDLTGTDRLHHASPSLTMAKLAHRIERDIGISVSIGLSYNKFLAKVASDLDKPRGFAVIGRAEATDFLAKQPVKLIWGVGKALEKKLAGNGITRISQLQQMKEVDLMRRYGVMGQRLYRLSRGEDHRHVSPDHAAKSISAERTFDTDINDSSTLEKALWPLCEKVSRNLKRQTLAASTVTVKLKTADFRLRTRSITLESPTQLAGVLFLHATHLLGKETTGTAFRLLGIGAGDLCGAAHADPPDLADPSRQRKREEEQAIDKIRSRFGNHIVGKGRNL